MDLLAECVKNYNKLLNVQYFFVLGKRGKICSYSIIFRPNDFQHLVGLQYLTDVLHIKETSGEATYYDILNGTISDDVIVKSKFYNKIIDRIKLVSELSDHIESDNLFFKFYINRVKGSNIDADFLMVDGNAHIFLSKLGRFPDICNVLYCKSAFLIHLIIIRNVKKNGLS